MTTMHAHANLLHVILSDEPSMKVKQLREWIKDLPDETPIWFNTGDGKLAPVTGIASGGIGASFGFMSGPFLVFASTEGATRGVPRK